MVNMNSFSDEILVSIFKHLDLLSRLCVGKTCKRWRQLITDSSALMDDVSEVYLDKWNPNQDRSVIPSVLAVFWNLRKCTQLKLGPAVAVRDFLMEIQNGGIDHFGKMTLILKSDANIASIALKSCLPSLPSSLTCLQIENGAPNLSMATLPASVGLECLHLNLLGVQFPIRSLSLPSNLRTYSYHTCLDPSPNDHTKMLGCAGATKHFLQNIPVGPSLMEVHLGGVYFHGPWFVYFMRMIRDHLTNLNRISFQGVAFGCEGIDSISREFSVGQTRPPLHLQWIKFENCSSDWVDAAQLLIGASDVKIVFITMRDQSPYKDLRGVYSLTPLIKSKEAKLELAINSIDGQGDQEVILIPSELHGVLSKLELIKIDHSLPIFNLDAFDLLTEIRLEGCTGLGDGIVEILAKWCRNLEELKIHPAPNMVTEECLLPFMAHWDDRKSVQLSIECLKPVRSFGGFNFPIDQEKGVFPDGKMWMIFRKSYVLDGCDQLGTRLMVWDDRLHKSMIITDYKRKFDKHVKIGVKDGKCVVKEKIGVGFQIDVDDFESPGYWMDWVEFFGLE